VPQTIEISQLDLRYEGFRMKNLALERKLLAALQLDGVREPLCGADSGDAHILLDGFKRLRCARSLGIHTVPYAALAQDQAAAIVRILRGHQSQSLTILEQARFVDELHHLCQMSLGEIAQHLSRCKSWVSMRLGLFAELPEAVCEKLFAGQFPARSYLYTIRPFTRVNREVSKSVAQFVLALSGRGLSVREIAFLFRQCFGDSPAWREQILAGRLELPLRHYRESLSTSPAWDTIEREVLRDLEILLRLMQTLAAHDASHLGSPDFLAQAGLLTAAILKQTTPFVKKVRELHARRAHP